MTSAAIDFAPANTAFVDWVRPFQAKELARMIGVAEATAKSWRAGGTPEFKHLARMVDRWRWPFLETVFAESLTKKEDRLAVKLEALKTLAEQVEHETTSLIRAGAFGLVSGVGAGDDQRGVQRAVNETDDFIAPATARQSTLGRTIRSIGAVLLLAASLATAAAHNDAMARTRGVRGRVEMVMGVL